MPLTNFFKFNKIQQDPTLNNPNPVNKINIPALISLCIVMFCIGIGWYIPGGIANTLMSAFPGITEDNVNLTLTLYLIGVIISAILIPILFFKVKRKWIIIGCTITYCISSIIVGFSTNFSELLFFRFLCGLAHGAIASIITVVAIAIAPKNKHGTSVTATLVSLFMATCTFVPIFTYVSNMDIGANLPALSQIPIAHQNWRWTFFATAMFILLGAGCVLLFVPNDLHLTGGKPNLKKELGSVIYWPFTLCLVFAIIVFMAIFLLYPLLQKEWTAVEVGIIHTQVNLLGLLLAMYGICSAGGNILGGIFSNGKTFPWIYFLISGTLIGLIGLAISVAMKSAPAILAFTLIFPLFAYMLMPNIYSMALPLARHHDQSDNVDFESGMVLASVGIGGMIGTALGGPICTIKNSLGVNVYHPEYFSTVVYIALAIMIVGLLIVFPIHWYMYCSKLVNTKYQITFNIFTYLPILIDKYTTNEVKDEIYQTHLHFNKKQRIIDLSKN